MNRRVSRRRRAARLLIAIGLALSFIVVGALLFADLVGARVAERLIVRALPWRGAQVDIARLDFRGLRGVTVTGVRVAPGVDGGAVYLDSLKVEYVLGELLSAPRRVSRVRLVGLRIDAVRSQAGWAWLAPFTGSGTDGTEPATRRSLVIDRVELEGASLLGLDESGRVVSRAELREANGSIAIGDSSALVIDGADVRLPVPGQSDRWLAVEARVTLAQGVWRIGSFEVTDTEGGRMAVIGTVGPRRTDGLALDLRVEGRHFGITQLYPSLSVMLYAEQRSDVDATVRGTTKRPEVTARVDLEGAGGLRAESRLNLAGGSPVLELEVDVDSVDVDRLTDGRVAVGPVIGRIDARLDVTDVDSLDGPLRLDLRSAGDRSMRIVGRADFSEGLADVEIDVEMRELEAQLGGRIRPIGPAPMWDLRATGRTDLPLPALVASREASWRGPWNATIHAVGGGIAEERATTLDVRLEPVEPTPRAGGGRLSGRVTADSLTFEAKLSLGGGVIDGAGELELAHPRSGWRLTRLDVSDFDLAPWVGPGDPGRLDASLRAEAVGGSVRAAVRMDSIRGGRLAGIEGSIEIDVAARGTRLAGRLTRGRTAVRINRLELAGAALRRASLTFTGVDPQELSGTLPRGSLSGRLTVEPLAGELDVGALPVWARDTNVEGRLELAESWLGDQTIAGGADLRFVAGELTYAVDLEGEEQSLRLVGTAKTADGPLTLQVDEGELRNVDLSSWLGVRVPKNRISGTLRGKIRGTDPAVATADIALSLDSTLLGPLAVEHGNVALKLRDGLANLRGDGFGGGRRLTVDIDTERRSAGSWHGEGKVLLMDSALAAADDTFDLRFSFATPDTLARTGWHAEVEGSGPLAALRLDSLSAELDLDDDVLTVTRLEVAGPALRLSGKGDLPFSRAKDREADLSVEGSASDLGAVLAVAGRRGYHGRARLALRSSGRGSSLKHVLRIGVGDFSSRYLELDSLGVTLTARSDSAAWLAGVVAEAVSVGNQPLLLSVGSLPLWVGVGAPGADGQAESSRLEVALDWNAAQNSVLRLSRITALLGDEEWRLREPAAVSWDGSLAVDSLVVSARDGYGVVARGRIDRRGSQDLAIDVAGLPVQIRGRDATTALARRLDLRLRLAGPAVTPRLDVVGRIGALEEPNGLSFGAEWTAEHLRFTAEGQQREGGSLLLSGSLPVGLSLAEAQRVAVLEDPVAEDAVDVRAEVTDFDLAGLESLLDPRELRNLQGTLNADVQITGVAKAPRLDGRLAVADFALRLEKLGTEWAADQLVVTLAGDEATVVDAEIRSGQQGTLKVTGGVELSELTIGNLGLEANIDRFLAVDNRSVEAVLSGRLALEGPLARPELRGRIHVDQGTYWVSSQAVPSGVERIELTEADYLELERRFGLRRDRQYESAGGGLWDAAAIDVAISAQSNVWARRSFDPALAVEMSGDVRLTKEPGGEPRLDGEIRAVEGRSFVEEFGRRFAVASASVRFNGPPEAIELEGEATYSPNDDVTIRLQVRGDREGFSLALGSDPEMDHSDIVSYIAVGRPTSDVQFGQIGGDAAGLGADIAFSRITGEVEEMARQLAGLDVVEIRQDGLKGLTLVAGRYTSRRLFLGFQQPVVFQGREDKGFGIEDTEVDAEYRVNEWLLANLSGSRSLARFFLGVRHAY